TRYDEEAKREAMSRTKGSTHAPIDVGQITPRTMREKRAAGQGVIRRRFAEREAAAILAQTDAASDQFHASMRSGRGGASSIANPGPLLNRGQASVVDRLPLGAIHPALGAGDASTTLPPPLSSFRTRGQQR